VVGIEADAYPERDVEILEGDGEAVGALDCLEARMSAFGSAAPMRAMYWRN
jgi:hypothetical protein